MNNLPPWIAERHINAVCWVVENENEFDPTSIAFASTGLDMVDTGRVLNHLLATDQTIRNLYFKYKNMTDDSLTDAEKFEAIRVREKQSFLESATMAAQIAADVMSLVNKRRE